MFAIFTVILAGITNSFWMALSKKSIKDKDSIRTVVLIRFITVILLFPLFIFNIPHPTNNIFWLYAILGGIFDVLCVYTLFMGYKWDYFATYGLFNSSPILVYLLSLFLLTESTGSALTALGVLLTVAGGLIFAFYGNIKKASWGVLSMILISLSAIFTKFAFNYVDNPYGYPFVAFLPGTLFLFGLYSIAKRKIDIKNISGAFTKIHFYSALVSAISTICWFYSVKNGNLVIIYTVFRVSMIFAFIFSWFMLKEKDGLLNKSLAGLLIIAGTVLLFV